MSLAKLELDLRSSLMETGLVQPVKAFSKNGHIEVLCRQVPGQEKMWLLVVANLLLAGEEEKVNIHICRRYVLKDRKMVFGWHIEINAKSLKVLTKDLAIVRAELEEARPTLDAPAERAQAPQGKQYTSPYKTDAQASREMGLDEQDGESGYLGRRVNADPKLDLKQAMGVPSDSPSLRVVKRSRNSKGVEEFELEMPLPHMTRDVNAPKKPGGKGATRLGGD